MDIEKTKLYYEQINNNDLCDCLYCQNYIKEIKYSYPKVAEYLLRLGVDIEKPFETMPLEPDEMDYIEYICSQYVVMGEPNDFSPALVDSVHIHITESRPDTQIEQPHFVIEIYPIRLRWVM